MADESIQSKLSKIAQGFNKALGSSPAPAAQADSTCPHCGQAMQAVADDVADPNKKAAADFQKGMSERPNYLANIKSGLGLD